MDRLMFEKILEVAGKFCSQMDCNLVQEAYGSLVEEVEKYFAHHEFLDGVKKYRKCVAYQANAFRCLGQSYLGKDSKDMSPEVTSSSDVECPSVQTPSVWEDLEEIPPPPPPVPEWVEEVMNRLWDKNRYSLIEIWSIIRKSQEEDGVPLPPL
jgi:hypothetical protein